MILIRIDFKLSLSKSNHINFWNKKPKPKKQSNLILDVILLLKNLYVDTIQILNVDTIQKNLEELEKHDQIQPIRTSKLTIFNLTFKFIFNQNRPRTDINKNRFFIQTTIFIEFIKYIFIII